MNVSIVWSILLALPAVAADNTAIFDAIRAGNMAYIKAHLTRPELDSRDRRGATPLMHAAAFGNLDTLKLLIDAGADVKARNDMDATALLWAASDPEKARLLIESGADVTVASKLGRTPLMVGAARKGGVALVQLLLSKGADVRAKDRIGDTALAIAARTGDLEIVKLLMAKGADPNAADAVGRGPLFAAAIGQNPDVVRVLLENGAKVSAASILPPEAASRTTNNIKNGPPNNSRVTALHNAAAFGPVESVRVLLKSGANVNAQDSRKLPPLSFALATEYPSLDIVRALIEAGADVNLADNNGDTPLDWAEKFGYPEIVAELRKAGAKRGKTYEPPHPPAQGPRAPAVALERTIKLLETTATAFFDGSGCVSCHHQNLIVRAQAAAKAGGLPTNEAVLKAQILQMKSEWVGLQEGFLQGALPGGGAPRLAENLLGLQSAGYAPDSITDSAIVAIAATQRPDGSWRSNEIQHRPPITQSSFSATAKIVRVLQQYAIPARKAELVQTIDRARIWLTKAQPVTSEDYAMRLYGLHYAQAPRKDIADAVDALLARQRPNGGWGPNPHMPSDAYATGVALTTLADCKAVSALDSAYQRGAVYLLSTQFPDGSWHVRSRSIKFQPYFESGFPFGHDQWISAAATAWAAQAIAFVLEPQSRTSALEKRP